MLQRTVQQIEQGTGVIPERQRWHDFMASVALQDEGTLFGWMQRNPNKRGGAVVFWDRFWMVRVFVDTPNGRYGNWIRIEHGAKLATVYGHLMAFAPGIEPGESVVRGELIGFVGSTGRSTGAHLHFEVLDNGKPVNPINHPELKAMQLRGLDMDRFRKQVTHSLEERTRESKVASAGF